MSLLLDAVKKSAGGWPESIYADSKKNIKINRLRGGKTENIYQRHAGRIRSVEYSKRNGRKPSGVFR